MGNQRISRLYLLILLLVPAALSAQQIKVSGRVTGMPGKEEQPETLPYTNVTILTTRDSTFVKGATSDPDGNFKLAFTPQSGKKSTVKDAAVEVAEDRTKTYKVTLVDAAGTESAVLFNEKGEVLK